ncbi:MAG TPA: hypothetical protein VM582_01695 [Candidatus Thermoplasmatota archaeon]|nr:hypothetical protein [Candidatus Thermoplasmatota archaeon]
MARDPLLRAGAAAALGAALVATLTGALLLSAYEPSQGAARLSLLREPAASARAAHWWAASAMVALALALLARAWVARPGLRAWCALCLGAGVLLAAFLTGRLLVMDQHAYESWLHATEPLRLLRIPTPELPPLLPLLVGHVLLPVLALAALLVLGRKAAPARVPWPALAVGALAVVIGAAAFGAPAIGPPPIVELRVARPDWPFLWIGALRERAGPAALLLLPLALGLAVAAYAAFARARPGARVAAALLVLAALGVASVGAGGGV